jgi:hypothetical protein
VLQVVPSASHVIKYMTAAAAKNLQEDLHPSQLLLNAVQHDHPATVRLVELLLQRGAPRELQLELTGDTALGIAVKRDQTEVRFLSFQADTL